MNFNIVHKHRNGPKRAYITMHYTDKILNGLVNVLATGTTPEPSGLVLIGESGVGKTSIVSYFIKQANRELGVEKAVIKVFTNKVSTLNAIYISILKSLGDIAPTKGTPDEKRFRIGVLVKNLNVQMIIFDDFHHVVEQRGREAARAIVDDIKMLMEELHIATVFVGIKSLANVGLVNEQIENRYNAIIKIPALNIKVEEGVNDLRAFIDSYISHHRIKLSFDITSMDNIYHVYAATRGVLRVTVNLIKFAKMNADEDGSEVVTKAHFRRVIENASLRHLRKDKKGQKYTQDELVFTPTKAVPFSSNLATIKSAMGIE